MQSFLYGRDIIAHSFQFFIAVLLAVQANEFNYRISIFLNGDPDNQVVTAWGSV